MTALLARHRWAAGPAAMSIVASGAAAATTLVVARGIGAAAFGRFTVILSIALIATAAMQMSLNYVMYQELPRAEPERRPALITTALFATLALGTGLTCAALLAAPLLTALFGIDTRALLLALGLALAMTVNQLSESFLRGLKRFVFVARVKLVVAAAYLGASAYCLLTLGVRSADVYIGALIVTNVIFAVVAVAAVDVVPRLWSAALARSLYRHGAYVTAIAAITAVVFGADVIFLNHWASPAEVGVYSVYNGFPKRLLGVVFTEGIGLVLLPAMATADKTVLMRRVRRLVPVVAVVTAVFSLAASAVFFLLLPEYPYEPGLMALSAAGIGVHTVFNLYFFALSMDGVRGAKVFLGCLAAGAPVTLGCQAASIAWWGVTGGLVAFIATNLVLVAVVAAVAARVYSEVIR